MATSKADIKNGYESLTTEFNCLYEKYHADVNRFALYLTQNREEAEELFQEIWLRVVKHLPELQGIRNPKSWIITIAVNFH